MKQYSYNRQTLERLGNPLDKYNEHMDWGLLRRVDNYLAYAEKQYPQLKETDLDLHYSRKYGFIQIICNYPTIKHHIEFSEFETEWYSSMNRITAITVNNLEIYDCIDTMVEEIFIVEAKNREFKVDN